MPMTCGKFRACCLLATPGQPKQTIGSRCKRRARRLKCCKASIAGGIVVTQKTLTTHDLTTIKLMNHIQLTVVEGPAYRLNILQTVAAFCLINVAHVINLTSLFVRLAHFADRFGDFVSARFGR